MSKFSFIRLWNIKQLTDLECDENSGTGSGTKDLIIDIIKQDPHITAAEIAMQLNMIYCPYQAEGKRPIKSASAST